MMSFVVLSSCTTPTLTPVPPALEKTVVITSGTGSSTVTLRVVSEASTWEIACYVITAVTVVLAVAIAAYSVYIARSSTRESLKMSRYTYLANKWYELKEKEYENPDFIDSSKLQSYETAFKGEVLKRYESFAWMCWAHAEDAFLNHYHEDPGFKPSIRRCKILHYKWLTNNRDRFDPEFLAYIEALS